MHIVTMKKEATALKKEARSRGENITQRQALDSVAQKAGFKNWDFAVQDLDKDHEGRRRYLYEVFQDKLEGIQSSISSNCIISSPFTEIDSLSIYYREFLSTSLANVVGVFSHEECILMIDTCNGCLINDVSHYRHNLFDNIIYNSAHINYDVDLKTFIEKINSISDNEWLAMLILAKMFWDRELNASEKVMNFLLNKENAVFELFGDISMELADEINYKTDKSGYTIEALNEYFKYNMETELDLPLSRDELFGNS